jgi:tRNA pseudouridine38-40 synthase
MEIQPNWVFLLTCNFGFDMARYALRIAYDGSDYHGWQRQENARTVQSELEQVLSTILRETITLQAAGRTDTGVHAMGQVAHFDSSNEELDYGRVILGTRALLPKDLVIRDIAKVADTFHARFDALWRQYRFRMIATPDPFRRNVAWVVYPWPDEKILLECASMLDGEMDFRAFCKADSALEENFCQIHKAEWDFSVDGEASFTIRANRFLHHMVRGIVGTMVRASKQGSSDYFSHVLSSQQRNEAVLTAPARGLFLEAVGYPLDPFNVSPSL